MTIKLTMPNNQTMIIGDSFVPQILGNYTIELVGYDKGVLAVKERTLGEAVVNEIIKRKSYLLYIIFLAILYRFLRRRTKTVADSESVKGMIADGTIEDYKRLYVLAETKEMFPDLRNLVPIELTDMDEDEAHEIASEHNIPLDMARKAVFARRVRAKALVTRMELPSELRDYLKGVTIASIE